MQTRVTPSLETLGERLNLSPLLPTEQTRQISVVVDLAPPDLNLSISTREAVVPSVTDLVLDSFDGRAAGAVTGRISGVAVDPSDPSSEGHECLVFFLGGIPSPDAVPKYWVFGTELPDADAIRHRLFSIVDRTPGPDDNAARLRNLVTTHSMDLDRPGTAPAAPDGRHFKPLFAPLILDLDATTAAGDESGISVLLQRLANPSIPDAAGDSRPGAGVYKSVDGGLSW